MALHTMSSNLRQRPQWLAFAIGAGILLFSLGMTGFSLLRTPSSPTGDQSLAFVGVQSPDRCRVCHEAEYAAWAGTTHARASYDPIFRAYLETAEQPGECFACHATGYDTRTGQFVLAGVSCEACHGPYRPDHPQASMAIAVSADLCGACHQSTLAEWQASQHAADVNCAACHEVHTQQTRAVAAANALCAGCHQDRTQDALHSQHVVDGAQCIDCHLSRPVNDDIGSAVGGHAATGHDFVAVGAACSDCHNGERAPTLPPS